MIHLQAEEGYERPMTVTRSMSPIKSTSPTLAYKTPSLMNINAEEELKDANAKIKELEETIRALMNENVIIRNQNQNQNGVNGTTELVKEKIMEEKKQYQVGSHDCEETGEAIDASLQEQEEEIDLNV